MSTDQEQYDETTGLPVNRTEGAIPQPNLDHSNDENWGKEGVDWEWDTSEEEAEKLFDFTTLHSCRADLPHTGYQQAITHAMEDRFGRLWLFDKSGRRGTQAKWCPFCGFQALRDDAPEKTVQITPHDIALTPKDKPTAVWVQHNVRIVMSHFQFGTVRVLASDGIHAKVLTQDGAQMTVCCDNMTELKGERVLPKLNQAKKKTARKRGEVDPEKMAKYLNMGL